MPSTYSDQYTDMRGLLNAAGRPPVLDRAYPLAQTPDAIHYLKTGQPTGKIALTI